MATDSTSTSPPSTPRKGLLGTLEVQVCEVKDHKCAFVSLECEYTLCTTQKKKNDTNNQFTESFQFAVNREPCNLTINLVKKTLFGERVNGFLIIALSDLPKDKSVSNWYQISKPKRSKQETMSIVPTTTAMPNEPPAEKKEKKEKKEKREMGKIRLELKFEPVVVEVEPLKGIVLESAWTAELSAGNITSNPLWFKNPQFMLVVSKTCKVELQLRQPHTADNAISFYVLHYDNDFFKGKPLTILKLNGIVKGENDSLCPLFKPHEVSSKLEFKQGTYCIIPCSRSKAFGEFKEKPHVGKFQLAAYCEDHPNRIKLTALPSGDPWFEQHVNGEWTEESSGGSDITESNWAKNPQFLLTFTKKTDVSICLHQDSFQTSCGAYLIKTDEPDRKAVWYKDQVASTEQCEFACSVSLTVSRVKPGTYIVIPCTFEAKQKGAFGLYVFSEDKDAKFAPITNQWTHSKSVKGKWRSHTSGGCAQHETFCNNPQYVLSVDASAMPAPEKKETAEGEKEKADDQGCKILLQLTQYESKSAEGLTSVGFMVFKRKRGNTEKADKEQFVKDKLVSQVDGYCNSRSVFARVKAPAHKVTYYTVVPTTFEPGIRAGFRLTAYCDMPVRLETPEEGQSQQ